MSESLVYETCKSKNEFRRLDQHAVGSEVVLAKQQVASIFAAT